MSLESQIQLLDARLKTGDILTPLEMRQMREAISSVRLSGTVLSEAKIESISFAAAHSICDFGEINSKRHNASVIAEAIRECFK